MPNKIAAMKMAWHCGTEARANGRRVLNSDDRKDIARAYGSEKIDNTTWMELLKKFNDGWLKEDSYHLK